MHQLGTGLFDLAYCGLVCAAGLHHPGELSLIFVALCGNGVDLLFHGRQLCIPGFQLVNQRILLVNHAV